jgi:WD40 repeat protein
VRQFSDDGKLLLTTTIGSGGIAEIWNVHDGKRLARLRGHKSVVSKGLILDNGRRALTVGAPNGEIKMWETATGSATDIHPGVAGSVSALGLSNDGSRIAIAISNPPEYHLLVLDARTLKPVLPATPIPVEALCATFTPDGKRLALGFAAGKSPVGGLMLLDPSTGDDIVTLEADAPQISRLSFSPDGRYLAGGNADPVTLFGLGEMKAFLWDADLRPTLRVRG